MTMKSLEDIWRKTHFDAEGRPALKQTKLTLGHFRKNCLSRMNVSLAAQVFSQTMISLFTVTLKKQHPTLYARMSTYMQPMMDLLDQWDHVFNIMNSRINDKKSSVNIHLINSCNHHHIEELLAASAAMVRWRLQAIDHDGGARPESWVTMESGQDCINVGLGAAAIAALHADTGAPVVLRRLDQDNCEHHFGNVRQRGGHGGVNTGTCKGAQQASSANRLHKTHRKSNSRGAGEAETSDRVMDLRNYPVSERNKVMEAGRLTW